MRAMPELPALMISGVIGAVVGTWRLSSLDERLLSIAIAAMIALYLVLMVPLAARYTSRFSRRKFELGLAAVRIVLGDRLALKGIWGV